MKPWTHKPPETGERKEIWRRHPTSEPKPPRNQKPHSNQTHHMDREQGKVGDNWNEGMKEMKIFMTDMEKKRSDLLEKLQETMSKRLEAFDKRISPLEQRKNTLTTGSNHPDKQSRLSRTSSEYLPHPTSDDDQRPISPGSDHAVMHIRGGIIEEDEADDGNWETPTEGVQGKKQEGTVTEPVDAMGRDGPRRSGRRRILSEKARGSDPKKSKTQAGFMIIQPIIAIHDSTNGWIGSFSHGLSRWNRRERNWEGEDDTGDTAGLTAEPSPVHSVYVCNDQRCREEDSDKGKGGAEGQDSHRAATFLLLSYVDDVNPIFSGKVRTTQR
ncbi:hypothetical protein EV426DRAFT_669825 [Tirmania nivea]|nr:hypothetical protein EV426DRAFT_669825 [Tirmania nivea]